MTTPHILNKVGFLLRHVSLQKKTGSMTIYVLFFKGAYIYIEASRRRHGDRARLISEWMEPNKIICLQFWFHMFGKHIGKLNAYMATDSWETIVWSLSGNRGDSWMFAQTTLQYYRRFKVWIMTLVDKGLVKKYKGAGA